MLYGRTHIDGAYRVVVGIEGRKWNQFVYFADGGRIVAKKKPNKERRQFVAIPGETQATLVRKFLKRGKSRMTKSAFELLTKLKQES